jgi:uncharacterized protein YbaA (DUF1428 family)
MSYVDGFVMVVPTANLDAYREMAAKAGVVWIEHGALEYRECVGQDLAEKDFCASFPATLGLKDGETVVFSYIVFRSREDRDAVNAKVMADPRIKEFCSEGSMPFDPKRMAYGGFTTIVDLPAR